MYTGYKEPCILLSILLVNGFMLQLFFLLDPTEKKFCIQVLHYIFRNLGYEHDVVSLNPSLSINWFPNIQKLWMWDMG